MDKENYSKFVVNKDAVAFSDSITTKLNSLKDDIASMTIPEIIEFCGTQEDD